MIFLFCPIASAQSQDVSFLQAFFINGDSMDVRIIDVSVSPDGHSGSLTEVIMNSYFFDIHQWSTESANLSIKKTGQHSFQLDTHDDVAGQTVDRHFIFEIGLYEENLYVPFEITASSTVFYQFGPNKGKTSVLNYIPIRSPDEYPCFVKQLRVSLPGLFYGVKRIK